MLQSHFLFKKTSSLLFMLTIACNASQVRNDENVKIPDDWKGSAKMILSNAQLIIRQGSNAKKDKFLPACKNCPSSPSSLKEKVRPLFAKKIMLRSAGNTIHREFVSLHLDGLYYSDDDWKSYHRSQVPNRVEVQKKSDVKTEASGQTQTFDLKRDIGALWQNPVRPNELLAINKHDLLISQNGGKTFAFYKHPDLIRIGNDDVFTSVAAKTLPSGAILKIWIGSSQKGVYELTTGVSRAVQKTDGLTGLWHLRSMFFAEEIRALAYIPQEDRLYAASRFQPALCFMDASTKGEFKCILLNDQSYEHQLESMMIQEENISLITNRGVYLTSRNDVNEYKKSKGNYFNANALLKIPENLNHDKAAQQGLSEVTLSNNSSYPWRYLSVKQLLRSLNQTDTDEIQSLTLFLKGEGYAQLTLSRVPSRKDTRKNIPKTIRAFYISPATASKHHSIIFDLIKKYKYNAVIIDVKDDAGRLLYGSELKEAAEMGNHRQVVPIRSLVKKLKDKDIYLIARQVTFKDNYLSSYKKGIYSAWDGATDKAWDGHKGEKWTDPFSYDVQDYNIKVAREVIDLGFDEVQFDYIRFPTDGKLSTVYFKNKPKGAYRSEAVETFIRRASQELHAPISVDVYGYSAVYRSGALIGQDIEEISDWVDVIAPMHYPSHFGDNYMGFLPMDIRTRNLIHLGLIRPEQMTYGSTLIRPWLQAFAMGSKVWGSGEPFMQQQIEGAVDAGIFSTMWWGTLRGFYLSGEALRKTDK